ncbi:MAG: FAD-binding oxidoreductase, partial [Actinomycetota bacterium]|nr:FAD-binding oxidoreductase [Actinomycetota bacterium]
MRSFWLESCGDDLTPRPALSSADADVAILGAGYTGLWTAFYLLQREPSMRVALVEREIAGFGASGRNGGWCVGAFPLSAGEFERRFGREAARELALAMIETVDEVQRASASAGIDCQFSKGGVLRVAKGRHQLPALEHTYTQNSRLGLSSHFQRLSAASVAERVRVDGCVGGLFSPDAAMLHPGRLVRGLARAVERRGAVIYEQTEVTGYRDGGAAGRCLVTARGELRAPTLVLAGEAYLTELAPLHRQLIPVYSQIALSKPLSESQWAEIGWAGRETISSMRLSVDYAARTSDGRLVFGSRGARYRFGSRIDAGSDRDAGVDQAIRRLVISWFPSL